MRMRTWLQVGLGALTVAAIILLTHFGAARENVKVEPLPGENAALSATSAKDATGLSAAAAANPPAQPVPEDAPRIKFDTVIHDFGNAMSGEALKVSFTFHNVGKGTLVIDRVSGG